jgi:pantoate kinase
MRATRDAESTGADRFVKAYAPAHITGFFAICEHPNPLYKGSIGCGLVLEAGCVTEVADAHGQELSARITINGKPEEGETTRYVLEQLAGAAEVRVVTNFEVPVGCGFGASAAGALSTALALNELLALTMTVNAVAQVAHCAEVVNSTGLGDVIAETYGGVVIRTKPGPPGIGVIDRLPHRTEQVSYVVLGAKPTRSVLAEGGESTRRCISEAGKEALKLLLRKPTLENFMHLSRDFALRIELISDACKDALEAVRAEGKVASVAMLGETIFVIGESEALQEFGTVQASRISNCGACVL